MAESVYSSLVSLQGQSLGRDSFKARRNRLSSSNRLLVSADSSKAYNRTANKPISSEGTKTFSRNPGKPGSGTRIIPPKKAKVVQEGDKTARYRKVTSEPAAIKLLSRVEQLRLLTKAEKAGLLSAAENVGLSLSSIEKFGLLSKAEKFGVLSAATDKGTPVSLLTFSLALLLAGPAFVYFVPEESLWQVILQYAVAFLTVVGGSALFAASNFVSTLQKSD